MYGSLLSVLFLGILPVWGGNAPVADIGSLLPVSAPSILAPQDLADLDQSVTASGVVIVDLDSGQTLYQRGADAARPMASLTKLMTALLIVENHDLNELVTVPASAADLPGDSQKLPVGAQFTVGDMLSALLIPSSNAAAVALAEFHSGSMKDFAQAMNERTVDLGLSDTSYGNAIGLDAADQQSTPRDLALLALAVWRHPEIRDRMSMTGTLIRSAGGTNVALYHSHQLLDVPLAGSVTGGPNTGAVVRAGKTGTTDAAGQCLLSLVEAGGRRYIAVLLHSRDRYADMRTILASLSR
jgi:serine-type D-Ala-D-Ala carboxypeptidase (penicillin-binding protein 5/6)